MWDREIMVDWGRRITAAGICPDQPFLERDPKDVERCFKINSLGTYYATQLAVREMVNQKKRSATASVGSVVHIASISAHQAPKLQCTSDYSASKGAVLGLTHQLGKELAPLGVRVNSISPGCVFLNAAAATH
jgi:sorbose reductase